MSRSRRWHAIQIIAAASIALVGRTPAQAPSWPVSPVPLAVVGVASGDPNLQLAGVSGARRLRDGRIMIANRSPLELRVYNPDGTFVSRLGRKGSGPGEFRGRITLYAGPGDSVLAHDDGLSRWTLYTPGAVLVRTWPATAEDRNAFDPLQYRRALVHADGRPPAACYRSFIDKQPVPRDSAYREIFPDGADRAWVRDEGLDTWLVRSLTGSVLGRVNVPRGLDLVQIGDAFVTGVRRDDDGIERVEVLTVSMPAHAAAPACAERSDVFPRDTSREARTLAIDLRNLETATEAYRADRGRYPMTLDSLRLATGFSLSAGTQLRLHAFGGAGIDAVARNPSTPRFCRILIGETAPIWLYRIAFCGS